MKYTDEQHIEKKSLLGNKLILFLRENQISPEQILSDYAVQWTVTTPLYNIGEHTYNLSEAFKKQYPETAWNKISGLRHRLIHDYEGTNWNIIVQIVFMELPRFIDRIDEIKKELQH